MSSTSPFSSAGGSKLFHGRQRSGRLSTGTHLLLAGQLTGRLVAGASAATRWLAAASERRSACARMPSAAGFVTVSRPSSVRSSLAR